MTMPSNYSDSNAPIPLLVACHGGSGNAKQYKASMDFDRLAEIHNFIVVYPDGMPVNQVLSNMKVWNSGYIKAAVEMGINDVEFLSVLIQNLLQKYKIDPARVYMTGHSNGAMMTYRMGGERADLFAAIAPTAGSIGGNMTPDSPRFIIPTPSRALNIIHIHGYLDKNLPYNGGFPESGYQVGERYDLSVNESISFWIDVNGCNPASVEESSKNNKIKVNTWSGGANGTEITLVTLWEVNHFTENMDKAIEEEELYGTKNLSELVWLLLSKYSKA
jgi:polyhydroxybutyrate depolymerase